MIVRLLLVNLLEASVGVGVAALLRAPLGTAYALGLVVVGICSAHLALVHVAVGWWILAPSAAAALAVAVRFGSPGWHRPRRIGAWEAAGALALVALLVRCWGAFATKPLDDYDAWAMWGMKARGLFLLGWADPRLFAAPAAAPLHLDYPLLVPSLDAVAARAMDGFDPQRIHLQFLLDGVAGLLAAASLLRGRAPAWLVWPALVAVAFTPAFTQQLETAYADVPLALLVGCGVLAAAAWIEDDEPRTLALATLFFAGAVLTKNEGLIFVVAALVALAAVTRRWPVLLLALAAVELVLLPWQIWIHVHHVHSDTLLSLQSLHVRYPGNIPLIVRALVEQMLSFSDWTLALPLFAVAIVLGRRSTVAWFAAIWIVLASAGLAWIYVVSSIQWSQYFAFSGNRVVDSAMIGAALLTPLVAGQAVRPSR